MFSKDSASDSVSSNGGAEGMGLVEGGNEDMKRMRPTGISVTSKNNSYNNKKSIKKYLTELFPIFLIILQQHPYL